MRKLQFWMTAAAILLAFAACKKVELQLLEQNSLLPLAVGNRWVYTDTMIATTSLPSADTSISQITYEVTRARWIDRLVVDADGKKRMERLQGWEILPSQGWRGAFTVFVEGDTIYSNGSNNMFWNITSSGCNSLSGVLQYSPSYYRIEAIDGAFYPLVWQAGQVGDSLAAYPAFHDRGDCANVGPYNYQDVNYLMLFYPLAVQRFHQILTTPAGSFDCVNYKSQWWAPGVGLVQTYHEGEASFYDAQQHLQTGLMRWKRTLLRYEVQ